MFNNNNNDNDNSNVDPPSARNAEFDADHDAKRDESTVFAQQPASSQRAQVEDEQFDTNWKKKAESFEQMLLSENLLRGIYGYGWETPSDIQQRAIVPVIEGHDVVAQAQSGRGKTGAFSIAALKRVTPEQSQCAVLILSPTRELSEQTHRVITKLGHYLDGVVCHKAVGGTSVREDVRALSNGVQIVVGTPGRVNDLIRREALRTTALQLLILDEADEMLSRGFQEQIYECFQALPGDVQIALFSATMPPDVLRLSQTFMRNPVRILVKNVELTLDGIKQFFVAVEQEQYKFATLLDLYQQIAISQAIIFVNSRRKAQWLQDQMRQNDFGVECIHGLMTTAERTRIMQQFRASDLRVLIATNLLARGIDVQNVSLVINYDLPRDRESYIHRIGRSGRFGRKGVAINFVPDDEEQAMRGIEAFYETKINELPADLDGVVI